MRIVSYNILDGGEGRADPVAEVIEAQRPDVVCLVEADNAEVLARIAKRLDMDSIQAWGVKHAVALLSRWPIAESINHAAIRGQPRCLLEALVRDPAGVEWPIGVVHFKGGAFEADEAVRDTEVATLLDVFATHRAAGRPHLLVGDFNANSPIRAIDPSQCTARTAEAWVANGNSIPRRVVQKLLDAGYADTLAAARDGSFTTQSPGQRIDYIFTHGIAPARIIQARIEQDRLAKYASDHFPVVVETSAVAE
ncbi:MAG: endonuclease/exonuclease/phosphatase family protein [Tepidisphaeraceae bacterium]